MNEILSTIIRHYPMADE